LRLALDVGCRRGTPDLRRYRNCEYIGIDIAIANDRWIKNFIHADAHFMPFRDNVFHYVMCHHVLEHVHNPYEVLKEIKRVWNHRGEVFIEVPNGRRVKIVESEDHIYSWIPQTFKQFLQLVFRDVKVQRVHPMPFICFNYRFPILSKTINGILNAIVYLLLSRKEPSAIRAFIKSREN